MTKMTRRRLLRAVLVAFLVLPWGVAWAQVSGARWWAVPLSEDPGISWMLVADTAQYRVLRDFAEPGATRRLHHHDATFHVLTVATGRLRMTIEGKPPVDLVAGQAMTLEGGVQHTFTNTGAETATIIEVFGKPAGSNQR